MTTNGQDQDEITDSAPSNNPFITTPRPDPGVIELELDDEPGSTIKYKSYIKAIDAGVTRFPWFGEFPVAEKSVARDGLKRNTDGAIRRLLVSFLAGRPMSEVANRVPTSKRNAYKVIKMAIYDWWGWLDSWTRLGLIRVWDIPDIKLTGSASHSLDYRPYSAPAICLLCHRLVGHIDIGERNFNSTLLEADDERLRSGELNLDRIRGHLIAHFLLSGNPKPNRRYPTKFGYFTAYPDREMAERWVDYVGATVIGLIPRNRSSIIPVVTGDVPTHDEVAVYYFNLL